ncbi:MAG: hypothetical protein RJB39_40 [Candidatus Parcubacteria bacterium]|jgi:hypothetical protein
MTEILETLISPEQQEVIKQRLSRLIEEKIRSATELYIRKKREGEQVDIVECLLEVWPENDGVVWIRKPVFTAEGYGVRFEPLSTEYDSNNNRFSFGLEEFRAATEESDIRNALESLIDSVYHEVEHIDNVGSPLQPETVAESIEYLSNLGEIQAHARQFASRYMREYPKEEFDLQRMIALIDKMTDPKAKNKALQYFVRFNDPGRQEQYRAYGDVEAVHQAIVEATKQHLTKLKQ